MKSSDEGSDEPVDLSELTECPDLRGVSVLWRDGDPPEVEFIGECNPYEAISLLRLAYKKLEDEYALPVETEDEDEDATDA